MQEDSIPVVDSLQQVYGKSACVVFLLPYSQHLLTKLNPRLGADASFIKEQRARYTALTNRFIDVYGSPPEFVVRSPGICHAPARNYLVIAR